MYSYKGGGQCLKSVFSSNQHMEKLPGEQLRDATCMLSQTESSLPRDQASQLPFYRSAFSLCSASPQASHVVWSSAIKPQQRTDLSVPDHPSQWGHLLLVKVHCHQDRCWEAVVSNLWRTLLLTSSCQQFPQGMEAQISYVRKQSRIVLRNV